MESNCELQKFAVEIRMEIVKAIYKKGGGHIGGSLSIADLVSVLYGSVMHYDAKNPQWEGRDYLVCSKGHAGPALYAALALKGFFPMEWLDHLNTEGTTLPGHCDRQKVPGIDATTGSLGQGLSIAAGIATGLKLQDRDGQTVYAITGDGEHAEGQIWEAVTYAAHNHLGNLIAFLDWNKKQIDGTNDAVMSLGDVQAKYRAFGWYAEIIDGSDVELICSRILEAKSSHKDAPTMLILDTIKGAGASNIAAMENNHCIGVPKAMADVALAELQEKYRALGGQN